MTHVVRLPRRWIDYLTRQPETGMGYQRVDLTLDNGTTVRNCLVLNAEEVELPDTIAVGEIREITVRKTDSRN